MLSCSEILQETRDALNSFDRGTRRKALERIASGLRDGSISRPPVRDLANNHARTFYSYCSMNRSPYGLVWEALLYGLSVVLSTDIDVLDAMEEMYEAGDVLGVKSAVSLETRAFVKSYADREINSPGEPGIAHAMGVGFTEKPAGTFFASLAARSRQRNEEMISKINTAVEPAGINYQRDVLPLTPNGNATERHICAAYDAMARRVFPDERELAAFWTRRLFLPQEKVIAMLGDPWALHSAIRAKFMKQGGIGYVKPYRGLFPPVEDFFHMVADAGAIPCLVWLDGLSTGEADPDALLDDFMAWGVGAVNVVPERNGNIPDPDLKKRKQEALDSFVRAARKRHLPILAGAEFDGQGPKFVDAFVTPDPAPCGDFLDAAHWLYGHTLFARSAGMGAMSNWASDYFGGDRVRNFAFYAEAGKIAKPGTMLGSLSEDMAPADILRHLR